MQASLLDAPSVNTGLNLLRKDGCVYYHPSLIDPIQCTSLFKQLFQSLPWQADQLVMFGKQITTERKVAWVGDQGCTYTYSGVKKYPEPWTPELLEIKALAEDIAQWQFNSCLLNLYHNGSEGMGWHSDNETELDPLAPIVSVSIGGVRKFGFKHRLDKTSTSLFLEDGSALIMHAPTQAHWNHSLLKTKTDVGPRINLTFRSIQQVSS